MRRISVCALLVLSVASFVVQVKPARKRSVALSLGSAGPAQHSLARHWNEELLEAIRNDYARPTVHARNLFHTSIAMWDAWAAYDSVARNYLHQEKASAEDVAAARREAISYASYRILNARFVNSPGAEQSLPSLDAKMAEFGYDIGFTDTAGNSPAALGTRIAAAVLAFGATDGANEENDYANQFYEPVNPPLLPAFPCNPSIVDPNRWQPLALDFFVDQSGNPFPLGVPPFQSPEWGRVTPFALSPDDLTIHEVDGNQYWLYLDPGPPPLIGGVGDADYRSGFEQVIEWSGHLDPTDGVTIDISPNARGDNTLGTNDGTGHAVNPATGQPYTPQIVPEGDYYRVLAEFWADGPDSETPPGHWFTIANYVSDHPLVVKRIAGTGPLVDDLEWDVKLYLSLAGAVHDSAVAAWGAKGWYDYIRPISAIRYMADNGQSSDPKLPSYKTEGIPLKPGVIELVTEETTAPGQRHEHLKGLQGRNIGKIAVWAWRGPNYIPDPETTVAGVGWILAENWWPYQRPTFVTPPFAGYVSGHSTFSRALAEMMTLFTGDAFFPGGLGEFFAPQNEFLVFEDGPSVDIRLQWATYRDASDETSISRIYGGIHPRADDIPGRIMGAQIGKDAFLKAARHYGIGFIEGPRWLYGPGNSAGTEPQFDALALTNFSDSVAILDLEAIAPTDSITSLKRGSPNGNGNHAFVLLHAGGQTAQLRTDFFEGDPSQPTWIELTSDTSQIGTFFQFGTATLSQLDGGVAITQTSTQIVLTRVFDGPEAFRGQAATTRVSILNPNADSVTIELNYRPLANGDGAEGTSSVTRMIPGRTFLDERAADLFGLNASGSLLGDQLSGGVIAGEVMEGAGVVALEMIQLTNQSTVLCLNAATVNSMNRAYSAQLASQPGLFTSVNVVNMADVQRHVTLRAVQEDGSGQGDPVAIVLDPGEQFTGDAGELFGTAAAGASPAQEESFVGSLIVEADGDGVVGDVIFGDSADFAYAASLPLQTQAFTEALFNQVANVEGFFSGLAFFYPGPTEGGSPQGPQPAAEITIQVFLPSGEMIGESVVTLGVGERISRLVAQLVVEAVNLAGGYVRIFSTHPMIGQMLLGVVGPQGIQLFSAVPPTVIR